MGGAYPQGFIESVRQAADIVRVVTEYVPLKQAGTRLKGLCPFHQEKTPSFSVDPSTNLFYCFGCQTGGDVFKFVQIYEQMNFPEAIEHLARRFGVPMPATTPAERRKDDARARLLRSMATADDWFRALLRDPEGGARCREYLLRRGLGDETVERLGLGFAPDRWDGLLGHLRAKGYTEDEIRVAGLAVPRKSGDGSYDRFRNRLMFPIRDTSGQVVAFGGRTLGDDPAKYINSPETPAYTKGDHLYGFDLARDGIRREGFAIVVEGYLDLAALTQAGFDNAVASLGTAFTAAQARLLARATTRVTVSYDGDAAGGTATARSLDLLLEQGFEVRVVELPEGSDPDDTIRAEGAEGYGKRVREAPDYLTFLLRRETRGRDLSKPTEKVAAVEAMLPHLARLGHAIERVSWATRLADALDIDDALVLQELRAALATGRERIAARRDAGLPRLGAAEVRLVTLLLRSESERRRIADGFDENELSGSAVLPIVQRIVRLTAEGVPVDYPTVLAALDDDAQRDLLTRIAFREEPDEGPGVDDCLWTFRREALQRRERAAIRGLGDSGDVNRRLMELQELARQRDALSNQ